MTNVNNNTNNEIVRRANSISTEDMLKKSITRGEQIQRNDLEQDINELIAEFNEPYVRQTGGRVITGFEKFLMLAEQNSSYGEDYGGLIVITDNQYIVANNIKQCRGSHALTGGKILVAIDKKSRDELNYGSYYFRNDCEELKISCYLDNMQIVGRLVADCGKYPYINFSIRKRRITQSQYESLERFFSDYAEDFALCQKVYGLEICFNGKPMPVLKIIESFKKIIDYDKEPAFEDETIIGVPTRRIKRY